MVSEVFFFIGEEVAGEGEVFDFAGLAEDLFFRDLGSDILLVVSFASDSSRTSHLLTLEKAVRMLWLVAVVSD